MIMDYFKNQQSDKHMDWWIRVKSNGLYYLVGLWDCMVYQYLQTTTALLFEDIKRDQRGLL